MLTVVPLRAGASRVVAWRPSRRLVHLLIPAVLGGCWLAVVLTRLPLPYPSDQLNYFGAAAAFPHGFPRPGAMHQVTRFGLVIPVRLAIALFGYSEAAYHAVPLLATLTVLAATYALGAMLFNPIVGAASAIVVITAMPMFEDAGALLPDAPATGVFTVAVVLALAVRRGRWPGRRWPLLVIGALLAWSYGIREYIIFAWPLIPIILAPDRRLRALFTRPGLRRLAWVAAPMIAYLIAEMLLCFALYGDPLTRIHAIQNQQLSPYPSYPGQPRVMYLIQLPLTLIGEPGGIWLTALLATLLIGALAVRRRLAIPRFRRRDRPAPGTSRRGPASPLGVRRRFALPLAWCALIWVPLTLAGGVLEPDDPALRLNLIRYWFPLFPPLAVGGLGALWLAAVWVTGRLRAAARSRTDRSAATAPGRTGRLRVRLAPRTSAVLPAVVVLVIAACAAGASIAGSARNPVIGADNGREQMAAFRGWMMRDAGHGVLWTDSRTSGVAAIYRQASFGGRRWTNQVRPVTRHGPRPRPGDLVLFFADTGTACGVCRAAERGLWGKPPRPAKAWRPVFQTHDDLVRVYRVGAA